MSGQGPLSRDAERVAITARRAQEILARRAKRERARGKVRAFAPGHLTDIAAMALILIEHESPGVAVTPRMVKDRVRCSYPWVRFRGDTDPVDAEEASSDVS